LVTGDKLAAREAVIAIIEDCGVKAWHAGPLANSSAAEALTSVLIFINKHYQSDRAGIRITGA
jgi:predicted dinucleotide-binding enzyme